MMSPQQASDEVTDLIASIEMHRQEIERESGLEASRSYALPRLQELLRAEQEAGQRPEVPPEHAANLEAVQNAIRKLQSLNRGGGGGRGGQNRQHRPFRGGGNRPPQGNHQGAHQGGGNRSPGYSGQGQGQGPGSGQGQGGQPGGQPGGGGRNRNRRGQRRRGRQG